MRLIIIILLFLPTTVKAESEITRDALDRIEEILEMRLEDGLISSKDILPTILVSATPCYEESKKWFTARVLNILSLIFGEDGLRMCEACMVPRTIINKGYMRLSSGPISIDEIIQLDNNYRGTSKPAQTAIWLDENQSGVSLKIIDLKTSKVVFAQNVDPELTEHKNSKRTFTVSKELERRARGDSLTHAFVDFAAYPGQHFSLDWAEQWGRTNTNLSGITLSLFDPVFGIGAVYYRSLDLLNTLVGVKCIMSVPTALSQAISDEDVDVLDPIVTGVFIMRIPFGHSNYGGVLTASTNGQLGIGISLLNISLLPVLP